MVKMQFYITGIIYILKYIKIENSSTVKMLSFTVFNYFWSNKCSLVGYKRLADPQTF